MFVLYRLFFIFRRRLDHLNSGFVLLLELCNPYLIVFKNFPVLSTCICQFTDELLHKTK